MNTTSEDREALRAQVQKVVDSTPGMGWSAWPDGDFMCFSIAMQHYMGQEGYTSRREDDGEYSFKTNVLEEDYKVLAEAWRNAVANEHDFEVTHLNKNGTGQFRWLRSFARPQRDEKGTLIYWLGTSVDIHDSMVALESARNRENRLRELIDAIPGLVWTANNLGQPTYFNKRLEEWIGMNVHELRSRCDDSLTDLLAVTHHPEDRDMISLTMMESLRTGTPWISRFRQRRADGAWLWMEARMEALKDETGKVVQWYGLQSEIEGEVRAQEALKVVDQKLAKAAQVAGMAELSGSIAHEVSQPLASAMANGGAGANWLAKEPPDIERAKRSVDALLQDLSAASDVVERVRMLFQQRVGPRHKEDINNVVMLIHAYFGMELSLRNIRLTTALEPSLPFVYVDGVQIQQVLSNLIRNAIEALVGVTSDQRSITISTKKLNDDVIIEVRDTGPGLPDTENIFGSFVTTKPDGMGMGLTICRTIAHIHDGKLWAQNNHPGASFFLALPSLNTYFSE
ncbi:PAS domain-containing protein [Rhizobium sp. CG4]|uniref:PAS domain-containing sensor histidine kinase n=1 Tax=Rhizobium sp. CG4 TaxID=2726075 RepID=UPI0020346D3B|nr:PAS domain-containing protein [Rhizobium sp. CG4]